MARKRTQTRHPGSMVATTGLIVAVAAIIVMSAVIAMSAVMVVPIETIGATPISAIMPPGTPMKFTLFLLIFARVMIVPGIIVAASIITVPIIALIPIVVMADGVTTV
ncbi:MAG: hypothetical protein GXP16_12030 [Gammaproteobacteria bacterium]|nr:hypothetical protein [Gammaproteobacteria bacterium]